MPLRSPLLLLALAARVAAGQAVPAPVGTGAEVSGVVYDSVSIKPLAGAMVQIVAANPAVRFGLAAVTDSAGRYQLADVPNGRFKLGFFHPMLDSLGLEPTLREIGVEEHRALRVDLAIPSPIRLRAAICGSRQSFDSGAVLIGIVRDVKEGAPIGGVTVSGEWLELSFTPKGIIRHTPRLQSTTGENGWFAICNVPRDGVMFGMAYRGADSTDQVEIAVPAGGFQRRDFYLGASQSATIAEPASPTDSLRPPPRRVRTGGGRLAGTVVTAVGSQPLSNAQVSIRDGPRTRTNDRGEWTLTDAPPGTRTIEIRAVGYYPDRRTVDIIAGAPPIQSALATLKSVLDTIKVTASRIQADNGFAQRRQIGVGRFLGPEDIQRRGAVVTSDLFKMIPGLRLTSGDEKVILMRGAFGLCSPAIYVDGHYMVSMSADDLDSFAQPERLSGVEVYVQGTVPPQYDPGISGCGSIVIWTKR